MAHGDNGVKTKHRSLYALSCIWLPSDESAVGINCFVHY